MNGVCSDGAGSRPAIDGAAVTGGVAGDETTGHRTGDTVEIDGSSLALSGHGSPCIVSGNGVVRQVHVTARQRYAAAVGRGERVAGNGVSGDSDSPGQDVSLDSRSGIGLDGTRRNTGQPIVEPHGAVTQVAGIFDYAVLQDRAPGVVATAVVGGIHRGFGKIDIPPVAGCGSDLDGGKTDGFIYGAPGCQLAIHLEKCVGDELNGHPRFDGQSSSLVNSHIGGDNKLSVLEFRLRTRRPPGGVA